MPIIKFVNESEKIEYSTEQDVCSLLCYAFDPVPKPYYSKG